MATPHDIPQLILRKLQETASAQEEAELEAWADAAPENRTLLNQLLNEPTLLTDIHAFDTLWGETTGAERYQRMEDNVLAHTDSADLAQELSETSLVPLKPKRWRVPTWRDALPYAAAIAILLSVGWLLLVESRKSSGESLAATEILPGGNRATLTLADGRTINLDEAQTGIVVGAKDITYQDGTALEAVMVSGVEPSQPTSADRPSGTEKGSLNTTYYVLTTPKGGTYQITLSDGSKVWLNANSTLKYPSRFSRSERIVELSGEAYFDIRPQVGGVETHDYASSGSRASVMRASFSVQTANQVVNVLGTQFNISAYADDPETKTTLVEGRVRVAVSPLRSGAESRLVGKGGRDGSSDGRGVTKELRPGTQSTVRGASIEITTVDPEDFTAWKNGYFMFNSETLERVMQQVARWYDVTVEYADPALKQERVFGSTDRYENISGVLRMLQSTEVATFEVNGRTVTVKQYNP